MKKVLCIALALALILAMAACTKQVEAAEPVDYSGTYDIIKIDAGEASASEEDMQTLRELGYEAIMSFADDGTGMMSIANQESDFTYDAEAGTVNMNGGEATMAFDEDGLLVITDEDGAMYLEKRAAE